MRFLADNMLGRLATWLRLLGYDTAYLLRADDPELARIARAEDRILLTRDVELSRRRGLRSVLIQAEKVDDQLLQLKRDLFLTAHEPFSRCPVCNAPLENVSGSAVSTSVPPYVLQTHDQFRRCPTCGRVYWRGTHWAHIVAQIQDTWNDAPAP